MSIYFEYTHFNYYGMYLYKQDIGDLEGKNALQSKDPTIT